MVLEPGTSIPCTLWATHVGQHLERGAQGACARHAILIVKELLTATILHIIGNDEQMLCPGSLRTMHH